MPTVEPTDDLPEGVGRADLFNNGLLGLAARVAVEYGGDYVPHELLVFLGILLDGLLILMGAWCGALIGIDLRRSEEKRENDEQSGGKP